MFTPPVIHILPCLILSLTLTAVNAKPSFIENDSIVFPDKDNDTATNTSMSDKLKECIQDNKIEFEGECRALLSTENVCPNDYWLVLDLALARQPNPVIRGKCVRRRCSPKQHFWVEQNRCVFPNASAALCPIGNTIQTDYFGDGYCECKKDPVHARDTSGACYPVFTRGPCHADGVWVQLRGQAECRSDQCSALRTALSGKVVVPWTDRNCYPINDRGPCEQGHVVSVNIHSFLPTCADPLAPLILVDTPCTGTDHSGSCTSTVNTPQNTFLTQVSQQAGKKRTIKELDSPK